FPKEGKVLVTARGEEKVVANDIFRDRVVLRGGADGETRTIPLAELREELDRLGTPFPNPGVTPSTDDADAEGDRDVDEPDEPTESLDRARPRQPRRARPAERETDAGAAPEAPEQSDASSAESDDDARERRPHRRRGRRGGRRNRQPPPEGAGS